jgi:hypothetical protein
MTLRREKTHTLLTAKCARSDFIAILQQLMFLSAALRPANEGPSQVSKCNLDLAHDHFIITLKALYPIADLERSCWHRIYQGGVIAYGLPIPRRGKEIGVELPFDLMVSLTDIWYRVEYKDGMILKGRTMALIPSAVSSDAVQWHLVTSNRPDLELTLDDLQKHPVSVIPLSQLYIVSQKRAILGYCSSARIWLGTSRSGHQHIRLSSAPPYKGSRLRMSRDMNVALGFAQGGTGSVTLKFRLPKTMMKVKSERPNVSDMILQSRHNPTLLYSVDEGIAYLVPELCVVMHLILHWAWHQHDRNDLVKKLPRIPLSCDGGLAAFETIDKHKDLELRSASQLGGQVTLLGLVERFLQSLQGLKELLYSEEYLTIDRSSRIVGWEFVDIALGQQFQAAKKSEIQVATAGDWPKALSKDPRIVNIFASNLKQPIRPDSTTRLCRSWSPLPSRKDFLVASMACISVLTERLGHDLHSPALSANFNLNIPLSSCRPCEPSAVNGCRRIANLTRKSLFSSHVSPLAGAVVIGNHKREQTSTCVVDTCLSSRRTAVHSENNSGPVSGRDNSCVPPKEDDYVPHEPQPCVAHQLDKSERSDVSDALITRQEELVSKTVMAPLPFAEQPTSKHGDWVEILDDDVPTKEEIESREIGTASEIRQMQPRLDKKPQAITRATIAPAGMTLSRPKHIPSQKQPS